MRETPMLELLGIPQLRLPDGSTVELRQKAFSLAALLHIEYRGRARRQLFADCGAIGGVQRDLLASRADRRVWDCLDPAAADRIATSH